LTRRPAEAEFVLCETGVVQAELRTNAATSLNVQPRQYRNNAAFAGFIHGLDTTCPGALFFRPQEIIEQRNENVEILWWHRVMPVMVFHAQVEGDPKACVDAVMDVFHHNDVADEYQHSGWEPPRVEYQVDRHQWCAVDDKSPSSRDIRIGKNEEEASYSDDIRSMKRDRFIVNGAPLVAVDLIFHTRCSTRYVIFVATSL